MIADIIRDAETKMANAVEYAKEEFAAKNPGKWNPYGALPQMRLLTYQMPDELLSIASGGDNSLVGGNTIQAQKILTEADRDVLVIPK